MAKREIVIGTRDSALALWQTNWVKERLSALHPDYSFRVVAVKTKGDKMLDVPLAKIGDKGLFTKELEVAMLEKETDMAVHSMKDLPTLLPPGLILAAMAQREDPRDVLVSSEPITLEGLPPGAKVGTSSLRRRAQLWHYRPDLELHDLRGNLQTRLRKMEEEGFKAIVLAAAGVKRMGWEHLVAQRLPFAVSLPAVGQGSIGIEIREDDQELAELLAPLNHRETALAIRAERAFLRRLEGGCQIPIGALGEVEGDSLTLEGVVASLDGKRLLRSKIQGSASDPEAIGNRLAEELLAQGAGEILREVREGACQEA